MSGKNEENRFCLALNVANQVTQLGLVVEDDLVDTWSITTAKYTTADEACLCLETFLDIMKKRRLVPVSCELDGFSAILACVVPDVTTVWFEALSCACMRRPLVVGPGLKTGVLMKYNDPSELGSDRIASIVAAKEKHGYPSIVINCDKVITYQVLDDEGAFVGGLITPGLTLSAQALAHEAARLPIVDLEGKVGIPGKNTRESVKAGIIYGEKARIHGLIQMIWDDLGYETQIILAGKDADHLGALVEMEVIVESDLSLQGLAILAAMNRR